jgi:invasion protein IalB
MQSTESSQRRRRAAGFRALFGAAAAFSLLLTPGAATAQQKPAQAPKTAPGVKRTTFDRWHLLCQGKSCAIATTAVRGVIVLGYNASDGKMVMQVRLPTAAPEGRPVAIRLHKSGSVLQLRVNGCQKTFCAAPAAADKTQQVVKMLAKETSGTLGYQLGQDMQIEVFSLVGFNKAYSELLKRRPAPKK